MNRFKLITIIIYIFTMLNSYAAFKLINNKESSGAIIIPDNPNSVECTAAEELQCHLKKSTGVCLPIINEKKVTGKIIGGYFLGNTRTAEKQKIDVSQMASNSYVLHYDNNFLYIKGKDGTGKETRLETAAGTLFGVYHYLQKGLKVRWLWPGKDGEYIPAIEELYLDNKLDGKYSLEFKFIWASALKKGDDFRWGRRVMNMSLTNYIKHAGTGGHAFGKWAETYGQKHPEWFAMLPNGKRNTRPHASMCISNDGFHNKIVELWKAEQDKNKDTKLFINVKENDTPNRCTCSVCRARDGKDERGPTGRYKLFPNVSERYAKFYKDVWEKAVKVDPDAKLSFYAYQNYFYAPRKTKLNSNFYVGLVPDIPFPRLPEYNDWLKKEYLGWKSSGASFYLRPNYFYGGYCMPEVWYDQYALEFKFLKKLGCIGVVIDGPSLIWATRGLDYYVMGRLCVEPEAKAEDLVNEYLSGFGKAAPEVRAYFEHWRNYMHKNSKRINTIYEKSLRRWYFHGFHYAAYAHKIFPVEELEKGLPYLERAGKIVKNDPAAAKKIDFLRQGLKYAIASSGCAEIFADPESSIGKKRVAWNKLLMLRKKLPKHAVNSRFLDRVEKNVWKFSGKPHGNFQELPEKWSVKADPENHGEKSGYYKNDIDCSKWRKASTWKNLRDQKFFGYENMWYRTSVYIPEKSSRKVILHLGAVDESCKVWVNGQLAGGFKYNMKVNPNSWEEPFELDISKWVKFGHENNICVKVEKNNEGAGGLWKPSYIIYRD